jgi:hypothetical protein
MATELGSYEKLIPGQSEGIIPGVKFNLTTRISCLHETQLGSLVPSNLNRMESLYLKRLVDDMDARELLFLQVVARENVDHSAFRSLRAQAASLQRPQT